MNFALPKRKNGTRESERRRYSNCNCNEIMENGSLMDKIEMFSEIFPSLNPLSVSSSMLEKILEINIESTLNTGHEFPESSLLHLCPPSLQPDSTQVQL
jgi:hypothetical protein